MNLVERKSASNATMYLRDCVSEGAGCAVALLTGVMALPILYSLHNYFLSDGKNLTLKTLQGHGEEARKEKIRCYTVLKAAVVGYNCALTLGSLLHLPFANQPMIVLFRKNAFEEIDVNNLDKLDCAYVNRICLQLARSCIKIREYLSGNKKGLFMGVGTVLASLGIHRYTTGEGKYTDRAQKITATLSAMLSSMLAIGWALKSSCLSCKNKDLAPLFNLVEKRITTLSGSVSPLSGMRIISNEFSVPSQVEARCDALGPKMGRLPRDLLNLVASQLKGSDLSIHAQASTAWAAISIGINARRYVQKNYPQMIIDAIGLERLALMPMMKLNDTLVPDPKVATKQKETFDQLLEKNLFISSGHPLYKRREKYTRVKNWKGILLPCTLLYVEMTDCPFLILLY